MAFFALLIWPVISLVMFKVLGRMSGVIWSTLIGALFLPEAFSIDLSGLPELDKNMSIVLGLLMGIAVTKSDPQKAAQPLEVDKVPQIIVLGLASLLVLAPIITVANNTEPLTFGPVVLKGLDVRDAISMITVSVVLVVPYLVAQRYLATAESHALLLRAFVICGLIYSVLVLFEVRMSPQLHTWVYGYFQHSWIQHVRGGAFRPIVFQSHGLLIGLLLLTCTMSAFILLRSRIADGQSRILYLFAGVWLLIVMLVSRNLGVVILAVLCVPVLWFLGTRMQILVAVGVMSVFLTFPIARQSEMITMQQPVEWVGHLSTERQASFAYRIRHENMFLERASYKPVSGWGNWGRWRVRDEVTGVDISTSDGSWIIVLGERGWLGFISYFGLLALPVIFLMRTARRSPVAPETAGLAVIMAAILLYQIPNSAIGPLTTIMAGALAGFVCKPFAGRNTPDKKATPKTSKRPPTGYTRFPATNAQIPSRRV